MKTGHDDLIAAAETLLRPHRVGDRLFGDVAGGWHRSSSLADLLPAHEWPEALEPGSSLPS